MDEDNSVFFGGPDLAKNALRDVLLHAIEATPSRENIKWVCYYLNDPKIVGALIDAANRGVRVTIILDTHPRIPAINKITINSLYSCESNNLELVQASNLRFWKYIGINWQPHLHCKLYYFSYPKPCAYIGSYNPTADNQATGQEFTREIGDHSISHNSLVKITEARSIKHLLDFFSTLSHEAKRKYARFTALYNNTHHSDKWAISFLPTLRRHPADVLLKKATHDTTIKCAISHFKGPGSLQAFKTATNNNSTIEILLEPSKRRTNKEMLGYLKGDNVKVHYPTLPEDCLMHNKFIIYQSPSLRCVMLGSFNWSTRSRLLNYEIIATTSDPSVFNAFETRWHQLTASL